ncbi:PspC domain-containing protein [Nocardiopsis sp. CNT-189]|uniref:ATP-binding protein n=1 Tax=Nocardiopsis oceanisediminis TaxID=2816862 RepID=UPI003B368AF5
MATETPGPAGGGAGPQEAEPRGGGTARPGRLLYALLWQAPSELPRLLPAPPERPVPPPLLGGVFAESAARTGRPVGRVRVLAALTVLPLLLYPVLWAVHAAGRPSATGRAAAGRMLVLSAAALLTGADAATELSASGSVLVHGFPPPDGLPPAAAIPLGASVGLPLLLLASSPLLAWRLMTAAVVAASLVPSGDGPNDTVVLGTAMPGYLVVLFVVASQYRVPVTAGVGAVTSGLLILATAFPYTNWVLLTLALALAALFAGDNLRTRREEEGRGLQLPGRPPRARPHGSPLSPVDGVVDAAWRERTARPGGPVRLLRGLRRPRRTRLLGGVCAALAGDSRRLRVGLRLAAVLLLPGTVLPAYPVLWLLLPSEGDPPPRTLEEDPDPRVTGREWTAWALLAVVSGLAALGAGGQLYGFHGLGAPLAAVLGALCALPLLLVPVAPLLGWRIAAGGLALTVLLVGSDGSAPNDLWPWPAAGLLVMAVLLYAVAAAHPGRVAGGAAAITVALCFAPAPAVAATPFGQPLWISAVAVGVTVLGASVRGRRSAQRELARESELRRRDQERKAAAEERSRIARELHDVVSHHMSMIAIQAEAAPYKYPDLPPGAVETFDAVRDAARGALSEMRRVVGLLREQGEEAERAPQPGLERLADLVDGARQAGMRVDLEDRSAEAAAPDAVGRSAYRIVQEALSNAARHAHGAPVRVRLAPEGGALEVCVSNGPAPDSGPSPRAEEDGRPDGHGLIGMRERAAVLGGTLEAGPRPGGGFRVRALLPLTDRGPGPAG